MNNRQNPPATTILPGGTIGILGSGQLGRMLTLAAKRLGYAVHIFSPDAQTPAGQVADREIVAPYDDLKALQDFAAGVDVVTLEFENIPSAALRAIEQITPVYPQPHILETTQHRLKEKRFLAELGIPVAPFYAVQAPDDLEAGIQALGLPLVLKTAGFGYDGKGQVKIHSLQEGQEAFAALGNQPCVLEQFMSLEREISVIAARGAHGEWVAYHPVENQHHQHILDITIAPANVPEAIETQALAITRQIMEALNMQGLLCVEFFITQDGQLWVNELAPRTHNSGHYSIEAAVCSQFEQQLRAICGLPLGETRLLQPAAMANLLGDLWQGVDSLRWERLFELSPVYLHLYGKKEAKPGRKMGHVTALGDTPHQAEALVRQAREALRTPVQTP